MIRLGGYIKIKKGGFKMRKTKLLILLFMLVFIMLTGCSQYLDQTPTNVELTNGNLTLTIVDAPDLAYDEVHINIQKIFIKQSGGGEWIQLGDYTSNPYGINLLDYRIQELVLPSTDVPVGSYEEIRIVLDKSGYITIVGDATQYPLTVGEVEEEEEKDQDEEKDILGDDEQAIDIEYPFFITENAITSIQIDFNVAEMIEENTDTVDILYDYILITDEVKAMDKAEAGEIEGKVMAMTAEGQLTAIIDQLIVVKLFDVNDVDLLNPITTTWATWEEMDDEDEDDKKAEPGKFKVRGIPPGEYVLTVNTENYNLVTIEGLIFEDGEDIEIGENMDNDEMTYNIVGANITDEYIVLIPLP